MPSIIHIAAWDITVINDQAQMDRRKLQFGDHEGIRGYFLENELTIYVAAQSPLSLQRTTLFHETCHAVNAAVKVDFKGEPDTKITEEEYVSRNTILLLDTLRRNPALVAFLLEA